MRIRDALSTGIVVLLMTLVVWVIADRSVLRGSAEMTVSIEIDSPDPLYRLTVVNPEGADPKMLVRFRGPGRAIDSLATRHRESPLKYRHTVRQQQLTGASGDIILPARLGFNYLAEEEAVSLEYARTPGDQQPLENIVVHYEREHRLVDVPVELSAEVRRQLGENIVIQPAKVSAIVLASQLEKLQSGAPLTAVPDLRLQDMPPGRQVTRTVPLVSSRTDGIDVTFVPGQVEVTVQLTSQEKSRDLHGISIVLEGPPELLNRYAVELTESRISVLKVTGPAAEVDVIAPRDVTAALVLTERDAPGSLLPRPLEIRFPEGSNIKLSDPPPIAIFGLRDRTAAPPPG